MCTSSGAHLLTDPIIRPMLQAETDVELAKQATLKQEITKSIVNMQQLRAENRQDTMAGKLDGTSAAPARQPAQTGWGASLGSMAAAATSMLALF